MTPTSLNESNLGFLMVYDLTGLAVEKLGLPPTICSSSVRSKGFPARRWISNVPVS